MRNPVSRGDHPVNVDGLDEGDAAVEPALTTAADVESAGRSCMAILVLFGLIQIALASFTMLALSSLSRSSRYVGILYAGAILFSEAMFQTLTAITGGTRAAWISLMGNLRQLGDALFRLSPRYDTPWAVSLVVVIGLIVVSVSILERRVRGVEVVT